MVLLQRSLGLSFALSLAFSTAFATLQDAGEALRWSTRLAIEGGNTAVPQDPLRLSFSSPVFALGLCVLSVVERR
jgi:hypothetical protein